MPEPSDILLHEPSSDDEDYGEDLLEQCIQTGITKNTIKPENLEIKVNTVNRLSSQQIMKENPIEMLRKGGNSFIGTNYDEPNRFHIEDSPCNFSIASGLSDLTVGSHTVGLFQVNR